ncbi:MAG: protein kinase [Blastocatellia bacterium]|nr:protein kinase [Blastocatellia bacterium]
MTSRPEDPSKTKVPAFSQSSDTLIPFRADRYIGLTLNHRYVIEKELGRGGVGVVYLARDQHLHGKSVVVKLLLEETVRSEWARTKFRQEIEALARIDHPGIVGVIDAAELPDGTPYLVLQFIEGITLRSIIRPGGLPKERIAGIIRQIGQALTVAHERGVFHRDLKPENIMLQSYGTGPEQVKIIDFGIARVENSQVSLNTSDSIVAGTVAYMSPEQLQGLPITPRSDIYSLGIIVYEMLTGKRPFDNRSAVKVYEAQRSGLLQLPSEKNPEVPPAVDTVVARALAFRPEDRYIRARDFGEALFRAVFIEYVDTSFDETTDEFVTMPTAIQISNPLSKSEELAPTLAYDIPATQAISNRFLSTSFRGKNGLAALTMAVLATVIGLLFYFGSFQKSASPPSPPLEPQTRTLAILPFRNQRPDTQTDFLSFSLADAVITRLGYVKTLVVRPSSYVEKYRNQSPDPQKIAEELKVDTLLTATYLKDGNDLRITAQLIDLRTNTGIWQDTIDIKYDKLLTIQDRVAEHIIGGLKLNLSTDETAKLKREMPGDPLAYEYFLRSIDNYVNNDYEMARNMLEKSLALDPKYALAWAHLGRTYNSLAAKQFGGTELVRKAEAAYRRALEINPDAIEAKIYMANTFTDSNRVEQAVPMLREVLQTNPNIAEAHWELGYAFRYSGFLQDSIRECERARMIDPSVKITNSAFNSYLYNGEYEKFIHNLPNQDVAFVHFYRGLGYFYLKDMKQAAASFQRASELDTKQLQPQIAFALNRFIQGETAAGLAVLHEMDRKIEASGVFDAEGIYKIAQAYAVLGDRENGLRILRKSVEGGFFCYPYLEKDPLLDNLRTAPQFAEILALARKRHEAFRAKFF